MSMRIFSSFAIVLAVAACGAKKDEGGANSLAEAEAQSRASAANNGMIECQVSGMTVFSRSCTVERENSDGKLMLVIRHDDGGFRRFEVLTNGRGVAAADGAEPATVRTVGTNMIEVQVAKDIYRLPATVKAKAMAAPMVPTKTK
jgi:hypothetical protein